MKSNFKPLLPNAAKRLREKRSQSTNVLRALRDMRKAGGLPHGR